MQLTLQSKIQDQSTYVLLEQMARQMSEKKRKLFVRYAIRGESLTELKREFIANHGITARQFNAIAFEVKGIAQAQRELGKKHAEKLERKLKKIKASIRDLKKKLKQRQ